MSLLLRDPFGGAAGAGGVYTTPGGLIAPLASAFTKPRVKASDFGPRGDGVVRRIAEHPRFTGEFGSSIPALLTHLGWNGTYLDQQVDAWDSAHWLTLVLAIRYLKQTFGGGTLEIDGGEWKLKRLLPMEDGVDLDGLSRRATILHNCWACDDGGHTADSRDARASLFGCRNVHPQAFDLDLTSSKITEYDGAGDRLVAGTHHLLTATAAHAGNFAEGELVIVASAARKDGDRDPIAAQLNVVRTADAATGLMTFEDAWTCEIGGLVEPGFKIAKLGTGADSVYGGAPWRALRDVTVRRMTIRSDLHGISNRSAMYNVHFEDFDYEGQRHVVGGNLHNKSSYKNFRAKVRQRWAEFKLAANDSEVNNGAILGTSSKHHKGYRFVLMTSVAGGTLTPGTTALTGGTATSRGVASWVQGPETSGGSGQYYVEFTYSTLGGPLTTGTEVTIAGATGADAASVNGSRTLTWISDTRARVDGVTLPGAPTISGGTVALRGLSLGTVLDAFHAADSSYWMVLVSGEHGQLANGGGLTFSGGITATYADNSCTEYGSFPLFGIGDGSTRIRTIDCTFTSGGDSDTDYETSLVDLSGMLLEMERCSMISRRAGGTICTIRGAFRGTTVRMKDCAIVSPNITSPDHRGSKFLRSFDTTGTGDAPVPDESCLIEIDGLDLRGAVTGSPAVDFDAARPGSYLLGLKGDVTYAQVGGDAIANVQLGYVEQEIPYTDLRRRTAMHNLLNSSAGTALLYWDDTDFNTGIGYVRGNAVSGTSATDRAAFAWRVPADWKQGSTIQLRLRAKVSTLANTHNRIDAEAYLHTDGAGGQVGAAGDLCATAFQALTASLANYDFTITPTSVRPGSVLWFILAFSLDDTGGAVGAFGQLAQIWVRYEPVSAPRWRR